MSFDEALRMVLAAEGGYSNNPADRGGATNLGISSRAHPGVDVRSLTPEKAAHIYKTQYWDAIGADRLPRETALVAFDAAVNHGPQVARSLLQRTGGDPQAMIQARRQLYGDIVHRDPSQQVFAQGWENRLKTLSSETAGPKLTPVEGNPFEPRSTEPRLTPVEGNPFGAAEKPAAPKPPGNASSGGVMSGILRGARDIIDAGAQAAPRILATIAERGPFGVRGQIADATGQSTQGPISDALRSEAARVDTGIREGEAQYQADRAAAGREGLDFARIAGNIATTAPLAAVAPTGGAQLAGRMIAGGGTGAALGVTQPVTSNQENFGDEKLKQAGVGFTGGALAAPVTTFLAGILKPAIDKGTNALRQAGVTPTIGQTLGGAANRVEQALASVPFLGDMIKSARYRSIEDFNRAAYNKALEPIGQTVGKAQIVGRDGVAAVEKRLSDAYDALLPHIKVQVDGQFQTELQQLVRAAQALGPDKHRQLISILQTKMADKFTPQGLMSGESMKVVESELGRLARGYRSLPDIDARMLGDAVREAQAAMRRLVERGNPQAAEELAKVNAGWANYVRLESAAARIGSRDGVFSPAQLLSAVRESDKSIRKGAFARGEALMQDFAETGKRVLGDTVPDSGTPLRGMAALAAGYGIEPTTATAATVAMAPYTRAGQTLAQTLLTARPPGTETLAQLLKLRGPAAGAALAAPVMYPTQQ